MESQQQQPHQENQFQNQEISIENKVENENNDKKLSMESNTTQQNHETNNDNNNASSDNHIDVNSQTNTNNEDNNKENNENKHEETTKPTPKLTLSVGMLGNPFVGKSSILLRYTSDEFIERNDRPTIGIEFKDKIIEYGENKELIRIRFWDAYASFRGENKHTGKFIVRNTDLILLCASLTERNSFEHLSFIMNDIKNVWPSGPLQPLIVLVATKADDKQNCTVSSSEAKAWAREFGFPYFETSSKTGVGIKEIFESQIEEMIKRMPEKAEMIRVQREREKGISCNVS